MSTTTITSFMGNVGIGKISPVYTLDVAGTIVGKNIPCSFPIPQVSSQWVKLGTFTTNQQGYNCIVKIYANGGYNSSNGQNSYTFIHFKSANGAQLSNGFSGDSYHYINGMNLITNVIWIGNLPGGSATSYTLYVYISSLTGGSFYTAETSQTTANYWTDTSVIEVPPSQTVSSTCYLSENKFTISSKVGIGTVYPEYPLMLMSSVDNVSTNYIGKGTPNSTISSTSTINYFNNAATTIYSTTGSSIGLGGDWPIVRPVSIYSYGSIVTTASFISISDRRIKKNIIDIDDDQALVQLRLLKPKRYQYKDFISKGLTPVYGFIAQEVKEVLNYSSTTMKDTIPNIYELATFSADTVTMTFNTADLIRDETGTIFSRIKLKTKNNEEFVNIVEVIDAHRIKVDKDLTEWGGSLDASGQVVPGDKIFVYGQEVDDFHTLNKDAIWTVATAALQEVDRQLQAEKQKTAEMQTTITDLQSTLALALARLDALEQKP